MAARSWLFVRIGLVGVVVALALGATSARGDAGPPAPTVSPIARGLAGVGEQLATDSGSWSTDATFTYQWLRCDAHAERCTEIPGAVEARYTAVAGDVGHVLVARVTATGAGGSAVAVSNPLGPVAGRSPGVKHRPSIKGTNKIGQRVYETADRWTHSPDTFTIRWLRCSATGRACHAINGKRPRCASGSCLLVDVGTQWDYVLTARDVGHRLRVRVSAGNGAGRATATSQPTGVVKP